MCVNQAVKLTRQCTLERLMDLRLAKIVSGGQTGVDRAALDAARRAGLPIGGWCPRGRRAEDRPIPDDYPLQETPSAAYSERTRWNVRDSDATLLLHRNRLGRGTRLTLRTAAEARKPLLSVDLGKPEGSEAALGWLRERAVRVLNVAGPRESEDPGIYDDARVFLDRLLTEAREPLR